MWRKTLIAVWKFEMIGKVNGNIELSEFSFYQTIICINLHCDYISNIRKAKATRYGI